MDEFDDSSCGFCPLVGKGGLVVGGSVEELTMKTFVSDDSSCGCCPLVGKGGLVVGGSVEELTMKTFVSDGGPVLVQGIADVTYNVFFEQIIIFNTLSTVEFQYEFQWNTGLQPLRWYQVQGCCEFPTALGSGLPDEPMPGGCEVTGIQTDHEKCIGATGKQYLLQTILARNVSDVCQSIKDQRLNWRICSIKRWSRPADPNLVAPDDQCNELKEVPFKDIPPCIEISLDADGLTLMGISTTLVEMTLNFTNSEGEIRVSGTAITNIVGAPMPLQSFYQIALPVPVIVTPDPNPDPNPDPGPNPDPNPDPDPDIDLDYYGYGYIRLGGKAVAQESWNQYLYTVIGATTSITGLEAVDPNDDVALPPISRLPTFTNTACGSCGNMPTLLYLHHNIVNQSVYNNFLQRNGFEMPNPLPLRYSSTLGTWSANFQLRGLGGENSVQDERWRFVIEWSCINELGGENLGNSSWKFSILAVQKIEDSSFDSDTRLVLIFSPEQICATTQNLSFDFRFSFDTQTEFVANQNNVIVESVLFNDKILLFKSEYWYQNPELRLRISQSSTADIEQRQNIRPIIPSNLVFIT